MNDNTGIYDLPLPIRVRTVLYKAGFRTVGQLRPLIREVRGVRGIGPKGADAIIALFREIDVAEPTPEQIAEIKRTTVGYGASVTWQEDILRVAYQAGWQAAIQHQQEL